MTTEGMDDQLRTAAITHGFAPVNGLTLHYAESGEPGRPLLVFLHGFPEFWYGWRAQLQAFARDYHCLAPDLPGYNRSSCPPEVTRYRANRLVDDVIAFAALFSVGRKFTLVAHDWGGALAWLLAIRRPDLLDKLIIINAVHPAIFQRELTSSSEQRRASDYIHALRAPDAEKSLAANGFATLWAWLAGSSRRGSFDAGDRAAYLEAWSQPGALTSMLNWYRAMRFPPPEPPASLAAASELRVSVPTRVIWGMADRALLPGCLDGLEHWVPDVEVHRITGATHWVVHEQPDEVSRLIAGWLTQ